jgi:hypothetical protein
VLGPVLAATARLVLVACAGWVLAMAGAPLWAMFALVAVAMTAYGLLTAAAIYWSSWQRS